jgi:methionyl-tRNA synthetase
VDAGAEVTRAGRAAPGLVDRALADADFRAACAVVWSLVEAANRYVEQTRPWELARAERRGDPAASPRLDTVLATLVAACLELGELSTQSSTGRWDGARTTGSANSDPVLARTVRGRTRRWRGR